MELASGAVRRNLYFFKCSGCGHDRESVFKKYADRGICRSCRIKKTDERQQSIFGVTVAPDGMPIPYLDIKI